MNKPIYLLYSCDTWKSTDSMSLVVATTNPARLHTVIRKELLTTNMEFLTGDTDSISDSMCAELDKAWSTDIDTLIGTINDHLRYGFINVVEDGEVQ